LKGRAARTRDGVSVRWGFRRKLFLVTLGLIVVSLVIADLYLSGALEADLTERVRSDLRVRLAMIEGRASEARFPLDDLEAWDRLADALGSAARARVTIARLDGQIIGDSAVALADLPRVGNHAARPETAQALREDAGYSKRWSDTVLKRMVYVATRFTREGVPAGVVRIGLPLTDVEDAVVRLHRLVGVGSILALGVALLLSSLAAHIFGRSLRGITEAARQIAQGKLDVRVYAETRDEIGELARTLDQLASGLSATLRELRAERDRLGRILEAMEEGVLVVDPERVIVMANPAARVLLLSGAGSAKDLAARRLHAEDNLAGRSLLEAVRNTEFESILDVTLRGRASASGEVAVDFPRARQLLVHAAPLAGEPHGAVVVLVDVTEIRRLESIRKDFVANVSHELRTPLTAVRSAIETALTVLPQDPGEASRFLAIADRHTERLTALVRDLLDLSRIESGGLVPSPEAVAAAEVASQVIEVFSGPAAKRKIRLRMDLPPDLPFVWADRDALVQVITNLVENAVKYGDEGGAVTISGAEENGAIRIVVEDTGPGIAPAHLPRLFERFYRVDTGRSRDRGGTGLGLSIVKHLVEAMGGSVAVHSQIGSGTRFTVTLPRAGATIA
jgi:two-component system, OmpR family, phosphate regulon sensor histidine kinase PhoR